MPPPTPSVALVPAAGRSRRMGRPKPLLEWAGTTLLGALVDALCRGGVERVVVVVAGGDRALAAEAERLGARVARNERPERGMLSSVVEGLDALGGAAGLAASGRALLVTPVDHPAIRPATVVELLAAASESPRDLLVPVHEGRRGHPLLVPAELVVSIPALDPAVGLRQLLDRFRSRVAELPVEDPGVVLNVNTPEAYRRLLELER